MVVDAGSRDDGRQGEAALLISMNRDTLGMPVGKSELEWSMLLNRTVFH